MRHIVLISVFMVGAFVTVSAQNQQTSPGDKPGTTTAQGAAAPAAGQQSGVAPPATTSAASDQGGPPANPPRPQLKNRTKTPCLDSSKDDPPDTFCGFLRYNYATVQKVCGLAPTKSWVMPWTWFRDTDPIKAVPNKVLSSMGSKEPNADNSYVLLEDTTSLSRLMTYVSSQPLVDANNIFVSGIMAKIESPDAVGKNLQFDPALDPEIMLVGGSGVVVHSLSCSDVWSAMVSSGISFNAAKAAAKISAEDDTDTTYKLVYGLFESPMAYMAENHPDTFYFEALDWYLRSAANSTDGKTPVKEGLNYIKAVRGIAVYSSLKGQTTTMGSGSASAGFSSPLFSIDASVSDNATSKGELKTQVFRILLGQASSANLPSLDTTANYLNSLITARSQGAPSLDSDKSRLKMSVEIDGMPHSLCQPGIWKVGPTPQSTTPKTGSETQTAGHAQPTDSTPRLVDVVYHKPGESAGAGAVRTRSKCEFDLSGDVNVNGNFSGILSLQQINSSIAIPFKVANSVPLPKLQALDAPPATSNNEGDWDFQIISSSGIDKSVDPDTAEVTVACSDSSSIQPVTSATFESSFKNAKGTFLKIHALVSPSTVSVSTCQLSGTVNLTATNGTILKTEFPKVSSSKQTETKPGTKVAVAQQNNQ